MSKETVKFKPFYDQLVVTKETGEKVTKSGIVITRDVSLDSYETGKVIRIGNGLKLQDGGLRPLLTKVGDTIIYRKNTDFKVVIDGVDYYVLSEGAVIGVLE